MSITFYYAPMSSATRVHWALEELGIPYEKVKVNLAEKEQKRPEYLALNPNGKVPTLVVDGKPMFESLAMLLFLGEEYGVDKGLFPKAGAARADAFTWMAWASVSVHDIIVRLIKNGERVPEEQRNAKAREAAIAEAHDHLAVLDAHLAGKEYILGDTFTLADCASASFVPFLGRLGVDSGKYANIQAWVGRCMTRPALGRAMQG
ncbi:MAG: glutathione S-transferase family protein [Polyangiaceae bacterium]